MMRSCLLVPILALVTGCQQGRTGDVTSPDSTVVCTTDDAKSTLIGEFLDGYTRQDLSLADTVFADDVTFYWADRGQPFDLAAWREAMVLQQRAFRDFELLDRTITTGRYADGNTWTNVWCEWNAVSRGTGERLSLLLHLAYRWDGDVVAEEYGFFDGGRFREELARSLALQEPSTADCPWDWILGEWRVSGGPMPDAVVRWSQPQAGVDAVMGEWIADGGVRTTQLVGWRPDSGTLVSHEYGSDGSAMHIVMDTFPHPRRMSGTFTARAADGTMSVGGIDAERRTDDVFVVILTDPAGTEVVRTFRPVGRDDALAGQLPPAADEAITTTLDDERSRRIASALENYAAGDLDFAGELFAPGVEFLRSDSTVPVDLAAWREGSAIQQAAFKDTSFGMPAIVTTTYPEFGTWTYAWSVWQGTSRATGETLRFPVHIMWQWDGDRVVREFGYFDAARFAEEVGISLARQNPSNEPFPRDWLEGIWKMSGGGQPDAMVNWSRLGPDTDAVVGAWVNEAGVRSTELVGWEPETGRMTVQIFGSDESNFRAVFDDFPTRERATGTYLARSGAGAISNGRIELDRPADDRVIVRMIDAAGSTVERILTPAADDDPMRTMVAPTVSASDWRTEAVEQIHAHYVAGEIDAMTPHFAEDCRREWGDPTVSVDRDTWLEGLRTHHAVFEDITLDELYTMTGQYPDGNLWTSSWFEWNGVHRKTGEKASFLCHAIHRWGGDKIVEEKIYFDGGRFAALVEAAMAE